jgi:hypothetical protein
MLSKDFERGDLDLFTVCGAEAEFFIAVTQKEIKKS